MALYACINNAPSQTFEEKSYFVRERDSDREIDRHLDVMARPNGATYSARALQNRAVTQKVFQSLLPESGAGADAVKHFEEPPPVPMSEEDTRVAERAAERMVQIIKTSPKIQVERTVREFSESGWIITSDNMHGEYSEVARRTFMDGVNWGRVIAFLAFSVSFGAYVCGNGSNGGLASVFEWTNQVLNETLLTFFVRENGWEGFITYADTLIQANRRRDREAQQLEPIEHPPRMWETVAQYGAGIGALGFSALLALGVRQAFS